jgi:ribose/xylose/arabinose/galactoside ABC-type transport system permease subunit
MREGAIDLSVCSVAGLGGIVAGKLLQADFSPMAVFVLATMTGGLVGILHGTLVARLRWPAPLVTLITAAGICWTLQQLIPGRALILHPDIMERWYGSFPGGIVDLENEESLVLSRPFLARVVTILFIYLGVMLILMTGKNRKFSSQPSRKRLFLSLVASGALAGLAGSIWLIDHHTAPLTTRIIGDLRPPVAAVLAGALLLAGSHRTVLVMLCLPATLVATTIWQLNFTPILYDGYSLQVLLLLGMVIVAQIAILHALIPYKRGRVLSWLAVLETTTGLLILAYAGDFVGQPFYQLSLAGLVIWNVGAVALLLSRLLNPLSSPISPMPCGEDTPR